MPDMVSGKTLTLTELKSEKATVIMFICNHCPFVVHVNSELVRLANDFSAKGVSFIAISSNDVKHVPADGPDLMKEHAADQGYPFPYLYDEDQRVAKAYDAACTPDFYVFDADLKAAYHGQLDDSRPNNGKPLTGADIRSVLNDLLLGNAYNGPQPPSIGCNIKWKE